MSHRGFAAATHVLMTLTAVGLTVAPLASQQTAQQEDAEKPDGPELQRVQRQQRPARFRAVRSPIDNSWAVLRAIGRVFDWWNEAECKTQPCIQSYIYQFSNIAQSPMFTAQLSIGLLRAAAEDCGDTKQKRDRTAALCR